MELLVGFLNNLKIYLSLIIVVVALMIVSWWLPQNMSVNAGPEDHRELGSINQYEDLHLDSTITVERFQIGDVACFYPEMNNPDRQGFAYVLGKPGDVIGVRGGKFTRNGSVMDEHYHPGRLQNLAAIVVPDGHLYLAFTRHRADSTVFGPKPAGVIRGKIRGK
jgi:hypothetical protein